MTRELVQEAPNTKQLFEERAALQRVAVDALTELSKAALDKLQAFWVGSPQNANEFEAMYQVLDDYAVLQQVLEMRDVKYLAQAIDLIDDQELTRTICSIALLLMPLELVHAAQEALKFDVERDSEAYNKQSMLELNHFVT